MRKSLSPYTGPSYSVRLIITSVLSTPASLLGGRRKQNRPKTIFGKKNASCLGVSATPTFFRSRRQDSPCLILTYCRLQTREIAAPTTLASTKRLPSGVTPRQLRRTRKKKLSDGPAIVSPRDQLFGHQLRAVLGERPADAPGRLLRHRGHGKGVRAAGGAPGLYWLLFHYRIRPKVAVVAEGRDSRLHLLPALACVRWNPPREMGASICRYT